MPIDHLLDAEDNTESDESIDEWVADHYKHLQTAFKLAEESTTKKTEKRQARHNVLADASDLPVGRRVLLRDRTIEDETRFRTGGCLIPAYRAIAWNEPDGHVNTVEPLSSPGGVKTVNRRELLAGVGRWGGPRRD